MSRVLVAYVKAILKEADSLPCDGRVKQVGLKTGIME